MEVLNNVVTSIGNYNNIPISITSNISVVNLVDGLTLIKDVDKKNWTHGDLTYTITVFNETNTVYTGVIITDVLDDTYVTFIPGSVTINGVVASKIQYSYNNTNHTLTIILGNVIEDTTIKFRVRKKYNVFFTLKNHIRLKYDGLEDEILSNNITVFGKPFKYLKSYDCDTPYWRT